MAPTLNILREHPTVPGMGEAPGRIVLIDTGAENVERWVVGWMRDGATHWDVGHYYDDRLEAEVDYDKDVEREERRQRARRGV